MSTTFKMLGLLAIATSLVVSGAQHLRANTGGNPCSMHHDTVMSADFYKVRCSPTANELLDIRPPTHPPIH